MFDYHLIRSNRKTIAIVVTRDAALEVRAPMRASKAEIDRFVVSKGAWINRHLNERRQHLEDRAAFHLEYGASVPLRGIDRTIVSRAGNRAGFDGEYFYMPPGLSPDEIKRAVVLTYRVVAKGLILKRVMEWSKRMNVAPIAVKINGAKTRWGSCSGKNSLNFSWRLVMAEDDVIDYVVVHELAHIKEHNHSGRFWAVVSAVLPDYPSREKKLIDLRDRLAREDWE